MLREVIEPNQNVGEDELLAFANRRGVRLPMAYAGFLLSTNGGQPVPAAFPIEGMAGNPAGVIQAFFGLRAKIESEDLEGNLAELEGIVPRGVLPIACTEGDDYLVIDLRQPQGSVLFWDRRSFWGSNVWNEKDLFPVARDFESLLLTLSDLKFGLALDVGGKEFP